MGDWTPRNFRSEKAARRRDATGVTPAAADLSIRDGDQIVERLGLPGRLRRRLHELETELCRTRWQDRLWEFSKGAAQFCRAILAIRAERAKLHTPNAILIMYGITKLALWLVGSIVLVAVVLGVRHSFSADAREARRRARSHGPVISRKRGPSVRLAVDLDKPKRRRNR